MTNVLSLQTLAISDDGDLAEWSTLSWHCKDQF